MVNNITSAINSIYTNNANKLLSPTVGAESIKSGEEVSFSQYLNDALQKTNELQLESQQAQEKLILGEIDIHTAMIAGQKAELALQYTLAIRNKIMDAYTEIMRMQV